MLAIPRSEAPAGQWVTNGESNNFPFRAVGKIGQEADNRESCTGVLVGEKLVLTTSRCSPTGYTKDMYFSPGVCGGSEQEVDTYSIRSAHSVSQGEAAVSNPGCVFNESWLILELSFGPEDSLQDYRAEEEVYSGCLDDSTSIYLMFEHSDGANSRSRNNLTKTV